MICGMESAISSYSCVYCKYPSEQYNKAFLTKMVQKQLTTLFNVTRNQSQKFGCIHPPLFLNVATDHGNTRYSGLVVPKFTNIYTSKHVTPYIHILVMHVFLHKYENLVFHTALYGEVK